MKRGAFGVPPGLGEARFQQGQQWLAGSAPETFGKFSRKNLDEHFPMLEAVASRLPPEWANCDGVIHIRRGKEIESLGGWFIAHGFQPEYSMSRSVPLWLAVSASIAEVREMRLPAILNSLDSGRRSVEADPESVLRWIQDPDAAAGPDLSVDDVRMAAAIHDHFYVQRQLTVPSLEVAPFWRGMQLLLEAMAESGQVLQVALRIEPSGSFPEASQRWTFRVDPACVIEPRAFSARGVPDHRIVERLDPRTVVLSVVRARSEGRTGAFDSLVDVPVGLLPPSEVRRPEMISWCKAKREQREDESCLRELAGHVRLAGSVDANAAGVPWKLLLAWLLESAKVRDRSEAKRLLEIVRSGS